MAKAPERVRYRARIDQMISDVPISDEGSLAGDAFVQSHWAKYICVLISGFIEQSVKEILLDHVACISHSRASNYIRETWPNSRNMKVDAISEIIKSFDEKWNTEFIAWLEGGESVDRKKEINEIVSWRNNIAHGKESATNNVTLNSIKSKFKVSCDLVDFLEKSCHI